MRYLDLDITIGPIPPRRNREPSKRISFRLDFKVQRPVGLNLGCSPLVGLDDQTVRCGKARVGAAREAQKAARDNNHPHDEPNDQPFGHSFVPSKQILNYRTVRSGHYGTECT